MHGERPPPPGDDPPEPVAASEAGVGPLRDDAAPRRTARTALRLGVAGCVAAVYTYGQAAEGIVSLAGVLAVVLFAGIGWIYGLFTWLVARHLPERRLRGRTVLSLVLPVLAFAILVGGLTSALSRARERQGLDPATGAPADDGGSAPAGGDDREDVR